MTQSLWSPNHTEAENSYMAQFMRYVNQQHQLTLHDYHHLHRWSIENPEHFWYAIWQFCQVIHSAAPQKIMQRNQRMQDTQWFVGAKLNFAENLLRRNDQHVAIIATSERGNYQAINYIQLQHKVANLARKLQDLGLQAGDRVAGMLPNTIEGIIAMLACTALGAIWSAAAPDFGIQGLVDRFQQIDPKILFTVDGHFYKGKTYSHHAKNKLLQEQLPSVQHTIVVSHLEPVATIAHLTNAHHFTDCIGNDNELLDFTQLPFNHPLYILYSSGTSGKPKCMVHSAGGTLLQHLKELMLHTNVSPNTRIFFNTTTTWMMWHWLVSNLALGTSIVLYEGSPFYPNTNVFFDLIDKANINIFGIGAKYLETCAKEKLTPKKTHHLSSLTTILATGSPLLSADFDYVYKNIKADVQLSSISGGSDIISCFALGNPLLPVYRGELQCLGLGMDVKIFNEQGQAITQQKGELVCTSPFPSMPIYFWNDASGEKYQQAYFDKFPNIWAHGDYAMITQHNGLIIFGRSDATLNPSGVRIGSAEIYQQLYKVDEVLESVAIGQNWQGSERIILFVILKPPFNLDEHLIHKIKSLIRTYTSPYHVPAKIIAVSDIPRTANGKISEAAVKKLIHKIEIDNLQAIANPECIHQFKNITALDVE